MQVDTLTKSLPTTKKAQCMPMLLGESEPLFTFIDQVENRPVSTYRRRLDEYLKPNAPNGASLHELVSLAQDKDFDAMDDEEEQDLPVIANVEDLALIDSINLAFKNADLNTIHLATIATPIPPTSNSQLSLPQQISHSINNALFHDPTLFALVNYDLHRHESEII